MDTHETGGITAHQCPLLSILFFGDIINFRTFRTLHSDFSDNEAARLFLRSFIFGEIRKIRTARQYFGVLPCVFAVALVSIRESSPISSVPRISEISDKTVSIIMSPRYLDFWIHDAIFFARRSQLDSQRGRGKRQHASSTATVLLYNEIPRE